MDHQPLHTTNLLPIAGLIVMCMSINSRRWLITGTSLDSKYEELVPRTTPQLGRVTRLCGLAADDAPEPDIPPPSGLNNFYSNFHFFSTNFILFRFSYSHFLRALHFR